MRAWKPFATDRLTRLGTAVALATSLLAAGTGPIAHVAGPLSGSATAQAAGSCNLGSPSGTVQHVIYIQFDNTHLMRDNPNVPSDLEQMPHLLNFMRSNGTVFSNNHTPLISHTATDILTSLTGLYGDHHGVPVANSFRYFNPNGSSSLGVSFAYWTDPIYDPNTLTPTDTTYNMLAANGKNTPAPWVPFTRAGCDVGSVGTANTVLENIATDIPTVFGANSTQAAEVKSNPDKAFADFVGIGVHCAATSTLCSSANGGEPDRLPDEPGGYTGYSALFGHTYVAPQISPGGPLTDLNGNVIQDAKGNVGFPGFDGMSAAVSLSYVAAMQEHGIPVTYAYISDAHDKHPSGPAYGPGQKGYVDTLKSYDDAFGKFFTRLASDGITPSNTLFVFTVDEGDHFVGGPPTPANCDGVTTPCTYNQIGELNVNLTGLLATQQGITTPFKIHSDDAPTIYVDGNPARDAAVTRNLERGVSRLTAQNLITGATDKLADYLADPVEMKLLHMVTADPMRTPTFTMFGNPDYFFNTGAPDCSKPCVTENPGFAWNHGDVQPDITTDWLGMVGPGVKKLGTDSSTWLDATDIRPTMMAVLGLKDDYTHDGRVLVEDLENSAMPQSVQAHRATFLRLAQAFKQLYATLGQFDMGTLPLSTKALASGSATDDSTYTQIENQLAAMGTTRDTVAAAMLSLLEGAEFNGQALDEQQAKTLTDTAWNLINQVNRMAGPFGFQVYFRSNTPGQGWVLFGPSCSALVEVATQDQGAGTIEHSVFVSGNELPGTVGSNGIVPGATYYYETVTLTPNGAVVDNNGGACYSVTVPGP